MKDSTTTVKVVCAILFVAFIISYIFTFQGDVLGMTQYAWADGKTHYDRTVGVVVIAAVMAVVTAVTSIFTRLPQRTYALNFFPAFLAMGLLTAVKVENGSVHTSTLWLVLSAVLFIAYIIILNIARNFQPFLTPLRSTSFLSHPWWTNVGILVVMMCMTYSMGNTDRTLHTRLAVERLCMERQWDKALATGFPQYDNDSSLTMLRAMALAQKKELGDKLFNYDVMGGSRALLPRKDKSSWFMLGPAYNLWQTIGFVPRDLSEPTEKIMRRELRRGTARNAAMDYQLCSYLLDKNLKAFIATLPRYYKISASLPQNYREAYVLYCTLYSKPNVLANDAVMQDLSDFMDTMHSQHDKVLRNAALRDSFFGTYWYYYYER